MYLFQKFLLYAVLFFTPSINFASFSKPCMSQNHYSYGSTCNAIQGRTTPTNQTQNYYSHIDYAKNLQTKLPEKLSKRSQK